MNKILVILLLSLSMIGCVSSKSFIKKDVDYAESRLTKDNQLFTCTKDQYIMASYLAACGDFEATYNYLEDLNNKNSAGFTGEDIEVYIVSESDMLVQVRIKGFVNTIWMGKEGLK